MRAANAARSAARTLHSTSAPSTTSTTSSSTLTCSTTSSAATRTFSTTRARPASHGSSFDPPSGWLWGVKPGEKYQKEGWEGLMTYGFAGSLLVAAGAYAFKPDTSIQTWALEEARRRLEAEGILEDPEKKA